MRTPCASSKPGCESLGTHCKTAPGTAYRTRCAWQLWPHDGLWGPHKGCSWAWSEPWHGARPLVRGTAPRVSTKPDCKSLGICRKSAPGTACRTRCAWHQWPHARALRFEKSRVWAWAKPWHSARPLVRGTAPRARIKPDCKSPGICRKSAPGTACRTRCAWHQWPRIRAQRLDTSRS